MNRRTAGNPRELFAIIWRETGVVIYSTAPATASPSVRAMLLNKKTVQDFYSRVLLLLTPTIRAADGRVRFCPAPADLPVVYQLPGAEATKNFFGVDMTDGFGEYGIDAGELLGFITPEEAQAMRKVNEGKMKYGAKE